MQIRMFVLGASLATLPAWAQPTAPAAAQPPLYRSVFADYRAWRDPEPMDWRAANRAVGALGGHMGHVRGHGQDAMPVSPPAPAAPAARAEPSK